MPGKPAPLPPPLDAFIALEPGKPLDLDMVRRTAVSAQWAAGQVSGRSWPWLASQGWVVHPVRIVLARGEEADVPGPDPVPPPRPAPRVARVVMPADIRADGETEPVGGRMRLLRAGVE